MNLKEDFEIFLGSGTRYIHNIESWKDAFEASFSFIEEEIEIRIESLIAKVEASQEELLGQIDSYLKGRISKKANGISAYKITKFTLSIEHVGCFITQEMLFRKIIDEMKNRNFERANKLANNLSEVDMQDKDQKTLLHYALYYEQNELVKYMIENGANINIQDEYEKTPLHLASSYSLEIAKLLIEKGANVLARDKFKQAAIFHATSFGSVELVKLLIERGESVNCLDYLGEGLAFCARNIEILKFLYDAGASIDSQNNHGWTCLTNCMAHGAFDMIDFLLEKGVSVNTQDSHGMSPLCYALSMKFSDEEKLRLAKELIKRGANVHHRRKEDGMATVEWIECASTDYFRNQLVDLFVSKGCTKAMKYRRN